MLNLCPARLALAVAAAAATLGGALAVAGPAAAAAQSGHETGQQAPTAVTANWPMFRGNPAHTGFSPETAINTTTAPTLRQKWSAKVSTTSASSPAVATSSVLHKAVVYAGANNYFDAYPAGGGAAIWSYKLTAGTVVASPAVYQGVVYFGSTSGTLYALNASTGALVCSFYTGGSILASPVVVSAADGSGPVVYDGTVPSSSAPGAEWALYGAGSKHGGCKKDWEFTGFKVAPGGTWSSPAYGTDADGVPLLVFGSKDSDDSVYALNATTGALVWRYRTSSRADLDVGAAPTISAPGQNRFSQGVVYVTGKDKIVYALNLTTGSVIWKYTLAYSTNADVSGSSLVGNRLYVSSGTGVYALNALTGALVWHALPTAAFNASPAVTGPSGSRVLLIGDLSGNLYALALSNGATLWTQKPVYGFWGSPAVSQGAFYVTGLDGVLRSYAPGGGLELRGPAGRR